MIAGRYSDFLKNVEANSHSHNDDISRADEANARDRKRSKETDDDQRLPDDKQTVQEDMMTADPLDEHKRQAQEQEEQARQAEEKRKQEARKAGTPLLEKTPLEKAASENAARQAQQAEELLAQRARLDAFEAEKQREAEAARQEVERKREAEARGQQADGEIRDSRDRYRIALAQHYDVRDPYHSLARAAMAEYGALIRENEHLNTAIAKEQNPEARKALELRQEIQGCDYMAITSLRIASQSEVITGRMNSEEAVLCREHASAYEARSKALREQYRDLAVERAADGKDKGRGDRGASPMGGVSHEEDQTERQHGDIVTMAQRTEQKYEQGQTSPITPPPAPTPGQTAARQDGSDIDMLLTTEARAEVERQSGMRGSYAVLKLEAAEAIMSPSAPTPGQTADREDDGSDVSKLLTVGARLELHRQTVEGKKNEQEQERPKTKSYGMTM